MSNYYKIENTSTWSSWVRFLDVEMTFPRSIENLLNLHTKKTNRTLNKLLDDKFMIQDKIDKLCKMHIFSSNQISYHQFHFIFFFNFNIHVYTYIPHITTYFILLPCLLAHYNTNRLRARFNISSTLDN